jgi:hypothetical protein
MPEENITITVPYTVPDSGKELSVTAKIPRSKLRFDPQDKTALTPDQPNEAYLNQAIEDAARSRYPNEFGISPGKSQAEKSQAAGRKVVQPTELKFRPEGVRDYPLDPIERLANIPISGESIPGKIATGMESAGTIAAMAAPGALLTKPALTAMAIGMPAGHYAQKGAEALGMEPGAARLTGNIVGGAAGFPAISPMARSGLAGAAKGALGEFFGEGRFKSIPVYRGIASTLGGAYAGHQIGGTEGAAVGATLGALAPVAKGAVTGAIKGARGKPLFDSSIIGLQRKSTGTPSPAMTRLPPSPTITTPPPEVPRITAPAGPPGAVAPVPPGTGFTMPGQRPSPSPTIQPTLPAGPVQRALPPPTLSSPLLGPEKPPIITPSPSATAPTVQPTPPADVDVLANMGATAPTPTMAPKPAIPPSAIAPTPTPVPSATASVPETSIAKPTVIARKPEPKLEANKLLGFLLKRKGASVDEIQEQFGATGEEARAKLKALQEDAQVYNKGGKWYEGKEPVETVKSKAAPKSEPRTTVEKPETKKLSAAEMMQKVKVNKPESPPVKTNEEYAAEKAKTEGEKTKETVSSSSSGTSAERPEYPFSREEIGKIAESLGVRFPQVEHWLTEHGYNVEPYGKYGLERINKKTYDVLPDTKFEQKFTSLMEVLGKPAPITQAEDAILSEIGTHALNSIKDTREAVNKKLGKDVGPAFDDAVKRLVKAGKLSASEHDYTDELVKAGYGPKDDEVVKGTKWIFLDPVD